MGVFYTAGESKVRPGVYQRYSNAGGAPVAGALNGTCAMVLSASWGPVNKVTTHESSNTIEQVYGACESAKIAKRLFNGGATKVYLVRAAGGNGSPGTAGTAELSSVTVNSKYPGSRSIKVKVAVNLSDSSIKNIYILDGTTQLEKFEYEADEADEREAFEKAVADSEYITVVKGSEAGVITEQEVILTGTDPTPSIDEYEDAFYALESFDYNVICMDKALNTYNNVFAAYIDEVYRSGKLIMGVVGEMTQGDNKIAFETRTAHAKAFNDEKIIYMGSGWIDSENNYVDGADAVSYAAGLIAGTPSTQSIVHNVVSGAVDTIEKLTNNQHEIAINSGMLTLSLNPEGQAWFDSGVNTLITPDANQDMGWKKIKRTKVRFEVLNRVDKTIAPLVGKVNCDKDGIANIIQIGTGVLSTMCAEKKIKDTYSMYVDPELGYSADSAWFIIAVDDIDSLEKIYLHYQFRYSDMA